MGNALSLSSPESDRPATRLNSDGQRDGGGESQVEDLAPRLSIELRTHILATRIAQVATTIVPDRTQSIPLLVYRALSGQPSRHEQVLELMCVQCEVSRQTHARYAAECCDVQRATEDSDLARLDALVRFNLPLQSPNMSTLMYRASQLGSVNSLEWWLKWHGADPANRPFPPYDGRVLVAASAAGHVKVLDFWLMSGLPFAKYFCQAIDQASANGHLRILDWWYDKSRSNVSPRVMFRYSQVAMDEASKNGYVGVLRWWESHSTNPAKPKVKMLFTERTETEAQRLWPTKVTQWWRQRPHLMGWGAN